MYRITPTPPKSRTKKKDISDLLCFRSCQLLCSGSPSPLTELEDNITALSSSVGCVYTPPHHQHRLWPSRAIDLCSGDMQSLVKRLPLRDISIKIVATM